MHSRIQPVAPHPDIRTAFWNTTEHPRQRMWLGMMALGVLIGTGGLVQMIRRSSQGALPTETLVWWGVAVSGWALLIIAFDRVYYAVWKERIVMSLIAAPEPTTPPSWEEHERMLYGDGDETMEA